MLETSTQLYLEWLGRDVCRAWERRGIGLSEKSRFAGRGRPWGVIRFISRSQEYCISLSHTSKKLRSGLKIVLPLLNDCAAGQAHSRKKHKGMHACLVSERLRKLLFQTSNPLTLSTVVKTAFNTGRAPRSTKPWEPWGRRAMMYLFQKHQTPQAHRLKLKLLT